MDSSELCAVVDSVHGKRVVICAACVTEDDLPKVNRIAAEKNVLPALIFRDELK
jgi:hypothetical protein